MTKTAPPGTPYEPLAAYLSFPFPGIASALPPASDVTPEALCALLDSWGTSPLAAHNLHNLPAQVPGVLGGVKECLTQRRELPMAMAQLLKWERGAREACTILADAGLPPGVALKGGSARYMDYPHPHLRSASDLDILLPRVAVDRGVVALQDAGFSVVVTAPHRGHTARRGHHVLLRREDTLVELHRSVDYHDHALLRHPVLALRGCGMPQLHPWLLAPCPGDALLVAAAHSLKHGLLVPLRSLVDVHLCLRRSDLDLADTVARAREAGLLAVLAQMAAQCLLLSGHETAGHHHLARFLPAVAARVFAAGRVGGNALPDGPLRKLVAHALLTPGWRMTGRLVGRYATRRALDFVASI